MGFEYSSILSLDPTLFLTKRIMMNYSFFLQRQLFLMKPKNPTSLPCWSLKCIITTMLSYLMSILPIASYIISLYLIAITRISFGFLAMINVGLIHPLASVPVGISMKYFSEKLAKMCGCCKILTRLVTFSINLYFALIASIALYVFKMWVSIKEETGLESYFDLDFKKLGYNLCIKCLDCEVDDNLQNYLNTLPFEMILYLAIVIPILIHILHSVCLILPGPVHMLDFIQGNPSPVQENNEEPSNELELQDQNMAKKETIKDNPKLNHNLSKGQNTIAISFAIILFVSVWCLPLGFKFIMKEIDLGNETSCKQSPFLKVSS